MTKDCDKYLNHPKRRNLDEKLLTHYAKLKIGEGDEGDFMVNISGISGNN